MEFKGTKGKWVIDDNYEGMVLTDMGAYRPNAMLNSTETKEKLKANAKLIAAAPELLEACQVVYNLCNRLQMPTEFEVEAMKNDCKNAIERALK